MKKIKPLILVTNDDGISAPGIRALIDVMSTIGEVVVVAPDKPQSAMGHAITINNTLYLNKISKEGDTITEYSCSGTPVDCVKIAVNEILNRKPDLCVSGVNHGSNSSINVIYSGTMSAAVEAGTVEEIYWVGGEPLMYEQHWDYMNRIIDLGYADRVYARYNTNLSRVDYKGMNLWKTLGQFRDWQVCASIDGTGEIGEYIRTGLDYNVWLKNLASGVEIMRHRRQIKLDYTITLPGLLEIKNMVELSNRFSVELLTKVTFAFTPDIMLSPLALPRSTLDEIIDENLEWLSYNANDLQQSLIDVLQNMKHRPTFSEQWPDTWQASAVKGKKWLQQLDKIRPGPSMEYILASDNRLLEWWNNINE